jgi:hypothetical protein
MDRDTERKWLRIGAGLVIASGVLLASGGYPATAPVLAALADLMIWPFDGVQTMATDEARLLAAIGGGVLVGWGWMLWVLAGEGIDQAPALARRVILTSVGIWFVVDSAGSLAAGAPFNVVGNLVFLGLFVLPMRRAGRAAAA